MPVVSVILPVYNAEKYVKEAIDSILLQTFKDFEFIIINDGSKDNSLNIIKQFNDPRIKIIDQENMGLAASLNKGIKLAKGKYIARQDNDDISDPSRLEKQVNYLEKNETVGLLGTCAYIIDEKGNLTGKMHDHSGSSTLLKFHLLFDNPFVHSSVMFRKGIFEKAGGYSTDQNYFEDHNLWSGMARITNIANLKEKLVMYREVSSGMSQNTGDYKVRVKNQSIENIFYYCPQLPKKSIEETIDYRLNIRQYDNYRHALKLYTCVLRDVSTCFCARENVDIKEISGEIEKLIFNFKRNHYNKVIYSDSANGLEKIAARLKRKILFIGKEKE